MINNSVTNFTDGIQAIIQSNDATDMFKRI